MIPTPEEMEATGKPICGVGHCKSRAKFKITNTETGKTFDMCSEHVNLYERSWEGWKKL